MVKITIPCRPPEQHRIVAKVDELISLVRPIGSSSLDRAGPNPAVCLMPFFTAP